MTGIILAIAVVVMAVGFLYLRNRIEKAFSSEEWISRIRDEIDELVLEMNQTAERNVALLEDRIKALDTLLDEADKRLLLMQKETDKSDLSRQLYTHLKKNVVPPREELPLSEGLQLSLADEERELEKKEPLSLKDQVMSLYGQGFSSEIISNKLHSSIAEVDLIISLHTEGAR
jgi:hypothetical protein